MPLLRTPAEPSPELASARAVADRSERGPQGFEDTVPHAVRANPLVWSADATGPAGTPVNAAADAGVEPKIQSDMALDLNLDDWAEPLADASPLESSGTDIDLDFNLDAIPDLPSAATQPVESAQAAAPAHAALAVTTTSVAAAPVGLMATRPCGPPLSGLSRTRRVLVISADADERVYARTRFAMRRLVWLDEATTTTQAAAAMDDVRYVLALINLDSSVIDAWALAKRFRAAYPQALMVATSQTLGPLPWWAWGQLWRAWQLRRRAMAAGFDTVLSKPLQGRHMVALVDHLDQAKAKVKAKA